MNATRTRTIAPQALKAPHYDPNRPASLPPSRCTSPFEIEASSPVQQVDHQVADAEQLFGGKARQLSPSPPSGMLLSLLAAVFSALRDSTPAFDDLHGTAMGDGDFDDSAEATDPALDAVGNRNPSLNPSLADLWWHALDASPFFEDLHSNAMGDVARDNHTTAASRAAAAAERVELRRTGGGHPDDTLRLDFADAVDPTTASLLFFAPVMLVQACIAYYVVATAWALVVSSGADGKHVLQGLAH